MRFGSVCSGIEAASMAWLPLGWESVFFSEIEAFPCAVLKRHFPDTPNWGDMTKFKEWPDADIDVLCGGTPCQSFSVAGLRAGLDDPRGDLMLTFLAIAARYRPQWLVWENVPGVLSSNEGRDFGSFLGGLAVIGYGFAYRVLDAQYFGLAQRRKRVFVVGHLGDWQRAAAVLFERQSLLGNPAPRRKSGERIAPTVEARANAGGAGWGTDHGDFESETFVVQPSYCQEVADPLTANEAKTYTHEGINNFRTRNVQAFAIRTANTGANGHGVAEEVSHTQDLAQGQAIAFSCKDHGADATTEIAPTLRAMNEVDGNANAGGQMAVQAGLHVRRLTPTECERLMGFPDGYTNIIYRGKAAADGPRYRALGNSWAVPVVRWIGERIQAVEEIA